MAHFALICPPFFSHVKVFEALAASLARHGHRTTFLLNAGAETLVSPEGPAVRTVAGRSHVEPGMILRRSARSNGLLGILRTVAETARLTDDLCRDGPAILRQIGADAIVGDQMEPAAGLLAAHAGLPFASIASALPINAAPGVPLPFLGWAFDPGSRGLRRNRRGERVARHLLARQRAGIEGWARRFGLPPRSTLQDCLSPTLQIAQLVESFDFPRPACELLECVGPIRAAVRKDARTFPFSLDRSKPFVFASFGTLQGHRLGLFKTIAEACTRLDAQLLVAHCGALTDREAASIGATFVTDFAPQAAVLARADVCITHGGLNTVLDALTAGVPMLAIPIAFDQPGIAARIVHHGVGERLSRVLLSSAKVEASLAALIAASSYREKAAKIGRDIDTSGGADLAAHLIDQRILGYRDAVA